MTELTIVVLFAICGLLGYLLSRKQTQLVAAQQKLQQSESDGLKAHAVLKELSEKQSQIATLDALVLSLRHDSAEAERRVRWNKAMPPCRVSLAICAGKSRRANWHRLRARRFSQRSRQWPMIWSLC